MVDPRVRKHAQILVNFCVKVKHGELVGVHGTTAAEIKNRRRAFSTRWMGDDVRYLERQGETSPPLQNLGLQSGDVMRHDLFPVLWHPPHD